MSDDMTLQASIRTSGYLLIRSLETSICSRVSLYSRSSSEHTFSISAYNIHIPHAPGRVQVVLAFLRSRTPNVDRPEKATNFAFAQTGNVNMAREWFRQIHRRDVVRETRTNEDGQI